MQIARALTFHLQVKVGKSPSFSLAPFTRDPASFRANLREHIATMKPLGFNAHALGKIASRVLRLLLGSPQSLAVHYAMLRDVFGPCADGLATSLRATNIKPECLPAVAPGKLRTVAGAALGKPISCLHKAMLSGPDVILRCTREALEAHLQALVDVRLFASGAEARAGCMQRHLQLLTSHTLQWLVQRKAVALVARGSEDDMRRVCSRTSSMPAVLRSLLLWQRARCAFVLGLTLMLESAMLNRARAGE